MDMFAFLKKKQSKPKNCEKKTNQIAIKTQLTHQNKGNFIKKSKQVKKVSYLRQDTQFSLIHRLKKNNIAEKNQQTTPKIINQVMTGMQNQQTSKIHKKTLNIDKFQDYKGEQHQVSEAKYQQVAFKHCIDLKNILKQLQTINAKLQSDYQQILKFQGNGKSMQSQKINKQLIFLKYCRLFKFQSNCCASSIKQKYCQIIQSCEILISKLINRIGKNIHFHKDKNNQQNVQKLNTIYVLNQEQFLLFFKHFFSKPYKLCNRPAIRKVFQMIWEQVSLSSYNIQFDTGKLIDSLKLWIYSVSVPSNPTLITLHKLIFQSPNLIPKYARMINNQKIYVGINESDALGLTPLMLAAYTLNKKGLQKLLKCGANPLVCPLYISQGKFQSTQTETKYGKNLFSINYPIHHRKQFNFLQILLNLKQYKLLSQCFYWMQLGDIKKFKKNQQEYRQKLIQIPDCSFQIHWKTFKGILCFKQLPSDIITIYKKKCMLRVDYHIDSIQSPEKGKHFTLIVKAEKNKQIQFYEIRHHSKKIINRLKQVDMKQIFEKYQQFVKYPHLKQQNIALVKGMHSTQFCKDQIKKTQISVNTQFYCQVMPNKQFKGCKYQFKNSQQYEQSILNSDILKYDQIQKSQLAAILNQKIINANHPKIKCFTSRKQKSTINLQLQLQKKLLNLKHMKIFLALLSNSSLIIKKFQLILDIFLNQNAFNQNQQSKCKQLNLNQLFPKNIKLHLQNSLNFQIDIKNINHSILPDSIFNVQCHLKEDNAYQSEGDQILDSLHSTVIMDDGYSINVSRFLGKTQRMFEFQQQQALNKFQDILQGNIISQIASDQEDNHINK